MRHDRADLAMRLLAGVATLGFGVLAAWHLTVAHQVTYVEGFLLEQAGRMATGGAFYRDIIEAPWIVDNFPPLYPWLLSLAYRVAGPSFLPGRLLTLIAVAGLFVLIAKWRPPHAWAIAALWLASPFVVRRALVLRMDLAALLLVALGVWVALHRRERRWALPASVLLFAAAWMTRQTALAAPAALVFGLWCHGRRTDAARTALALAGLIVLAVVLLQAWSDGFLRHIVLYNTGTYDVGQVPRKYGAMLGLQAPLVVLGVLGARRVWREGGLAGRVLPAWLLLSALAALTVGKPGSTYNHFLEPLFVAALLAAPGLREAATLLRTHRPRAAPTPLLAAALALQLVVTAASGPLHTAIDAGRQDDDGARLVAALGGFDGPVLSEHAGAVVQSGHEVLFEPRTFHELHAAGLWDDAPLVAAIHARTFDVIVLERFSPDEPQRTGARFTPDAWTAIQANYMPDQQIGHWWLWVPEGA